MSPEGAGDELVPVHLLQLPVPLAAGAREHFEGLKREFVLLSAGADDEHHVPARLLRLVTSLTTRYAGVSSAADQRLEAAIDAGAQVLDDHVLALPSQAAPAVQALGDLIDEADDYCRRGQHLLTLATPEDCRAYRHWYLGEIVGQLAGRAPVPWPTSPHAAALRS